MIDRLEAILEKYKSLEEELTKPEVLSDIKKTRTYSKEMADLEETVNTYREYKKVLDGIEETKEMVKDPEFGEIARDELKNLEDEKVKLEGELEILLIPKDPNDSKNVILVEMKLISLLEIYLECILDTLKNKAFHIKYITR